MGEPIMTNQDLIVDGDENIYNVGKTNRKFSTVQAAMDQALADGRDWNSPAVIDIGPGEWNENVICRVSAVTIRGDSVENTRIRVTSGDALTFDIFGTDYTWSGEITNLTVESTDVTGSGVKITGAAGSSIAGNEIKFVQCNLRGGLYSLYAETANYIAMMDTWCSSKVKIVNCAGLWTNGNIEANDLEYDYDVANPQPSDTGNYGLSTQDTYFTAGLVEIKGSAPAKLTGGEINNLTGSGTGTVTLINAPVLGTWTKGTNTWVEKGNSLYVKVNNTATANPTVNDDNTQGYSVGSVWINNTTGIGFICLDISTGAAHWHMITQADPYFSQLAVKAKDIKNLTYSEVGTTLWDDGDFSIYTVRKFEFIIDMNGSGDNISVRLYDVVNAVELGSLTGISTGGLLSFTFTKPTSDTTIELQVKKDTDVSTDPIIESGLIELESGI